MDLHIEGILETLLVGAIVSLFVLSVLFFFLGHLLRVNSVRRFFTFLIYEDDALNEPDPVDVPLLPAPHHRGTTPVHRPAPSHFVLVVLTALLFGAGVVAESWSHTDQDEHDSQTKLKAFGAVVHGRLASGADPEPRLAQFVADYDACHFTHTNAAPIGTRDVDRLESERAKGNDLSPCLQIDVRVLEFYHNAKNAVFQQESYNEELVNLQSRINFVRSVRLILGWLKVELAIVAAIAALAHILSWWREKRSGRWLRNLYQRIPTVVLPFCRHWGNLAPIRCVLMFGALFVFCRSTAQAADECQSQFDKRVYGYFLSLGDRHGTSGAPSDKGDGEEIQASGPARPTSGARDLNSSSPSSDTKSEGTPDAKGAGTTLVEHGEPPAMRERDITPRSPYFVFSTPGNTPGEHLEPSAVRKMGDGLRVIVANDVDKDGQQMFWLFDVEGTDKLVHPERICTSDDESTINAFHGVRNVEAMYASDPGPGGFVEVLVAPTFEKTDDRKLVRFCINPKRHSNWDDEHHCQRIDGPADTVPVEDPCAALANKNTPGEVSCRIEGMTSADIKRELLFGVHDAHVPSLTERGGTAMKPTVAIVRMVPSGNGWIRDRDWDKDEEKVFFREENLEDDCHSQSGISDLSARPNGLLYVLTSVDLGDTGTCSEHEKPPLPEVAQVRGALWRLDLNHRDKKSRLRLLYRFAHKPAGITDVGDGSLLVVFDDDGQRKSPIWAPRTFALRQNEAVFTLLPAAGELRAPVPTPSPQSPSLVSSTAGSQ